MNQGKRSVKPNVLVTRKLLPAVEERMAQLFDCDFNTDDRAMNKEEIIDGLANKEVLVPTVTDTIDADFIECLPDSVKLIANFGSGVNHIDLATAKKRNIIITNTPGVFTDDTADLTMALILSVPRRLAEGEKLMRSGDWQGWDPSSMLGHRISGKTLGIIGFGRIGEAVSRRAKALGLSILYNKRKRLPASSEDELGICYEEDIDRLIARSDIISIHCPLTRETDNLINADRIALMRSNAYIINTSRGEIIDENALIEALEKEQIAGAGLDVYTHEPAVDKRLLALANVVLLPHMGSATFEGRTASGERVIANIRVWADGHRPPDQILDGLA